jgi:acyl-CoA thioesterase FadM
MYPFVRLTKELLKYRNAPRLEPQQPHVSQHICWPWDLDPWVELNNGRTLTLFDLGRIPFGRRLGMHHALAERGWRLTVAGSTVRYRRRVRPFDRLEMVTRLVGWDTRFMYVEQSMWRRGDCTSHILLRSAVIDANGIVAPGRLMAALGGSRESPELPGWIAAWIAAEADRPWPPHRPGDG